uniref:Glycoside hydrolase family 28 n=1 Tax=Diabrotica virgifera virgifera TaxID=50390 RepID=A0A088BZ88_DIAVI|nr:glycoside hydrolase family 28 [Diabrotica virgifera virgifera]
MSFNKFFYSLLFVVVSAAAKSLNEDYCTITQYSQVSDVVKNCKNIVISNLRVPANKTLNLNLQDGSELTFEGRTYFEYFEWKGPLVNITGDDLIVRGAPGHVLDGQGELYWDHLGGKGIKKPKFIRLQGNNSRYENIYLKNCPVHCASVAVSNSVIDGWFIDVSEGDKNNFTGHNTDGFDLSSTNLILQNSIVKNQDDCVVVNVGANILVRNMACYGGHGLSISAGFSKDDFTKNSVYNVTFEDSLVHRSPNGIHVKTHADSGPGIIQNVIYRNIRFEDINNFALNIQQDYVNGEATGIPGTNIPIVGLSLDNISGWMKSFNESPTLEALILCGDGACDKWEFHNIDITGAQNNSICTFQPEGYSC